MAERDVVRREMGPVGLIAQRDGERKCYYDRSPALVIHETREEKM